mmetsp:Transcript_13877/g.45921  ORF Transcript_13877/g.45921 Transcript_13877/m.45921 type:complete len:255 (-) Transcript_13877:4932-5696(-)
MFRHRRHWCAFSLQCEHTPCLSVTCLVHRGHLVVSLALLSGLTRKDSKRTAIAQNVTGVGKTTAHSCLFGAIVHTAILVHKAFPSTEPSSDFAFNVATSTDGSSHRNTLNREARTARLLDANGGADTKICETRLGARNLAEIAQCVCHKSVDRDVSKLRVANADVLSSSPIAAQRADAKTLGVVSNVKKSSALFGGSAAESRDSAAYTDAFRCVPRTSILFATRAASADRMSDSTENKSWKSDKSPCSKHHRAK